MKLVVSCMTSFFLCLSVLFYSVLVIAGYVSDSVHSYGGPTPMALDTAISLALLGIAGALLATYGIRKHVE